MALNNNGNNNNSDNNNNNSRSFITFDIFEIAVQYEFPLSARGVDSSTKSAACFLFVFSFSPVFTPVLSLVCYLTAFTCLLFVN